MFELYPNLRAEGEILLEGHNILGNDVDVNLLRAKVGMVFQKPTPFPMSIYDNVSFGIKLYERVSKSEMDDRVEWALKKPRCGKRSKTSSSSRATRCLVPTAARCVLRVPWPTSPKCYCWTSRPRSSTRFLRRKSGLTHEAERRDCTIAIVTHNMQQAVRVSDAFTAYMYLGDLVEFSETDQIFTAPKQKATEDYITGKFG